MNTSGNPTIRAVIDPSGAQSGAASVVAALNQIKSAANNNGLGGRNSGLSASQQAAQAMASAMATNTSAIKAQTAASQALSGQMSSLAGSMTQAGNAAHSSASSHAGLAGELKGLAGELLGAYLGFEGLKKAMEMSDEMSGMNAKLRLAIDGWGDYALAQQQVLAISSQTRSDLVTTGELYATVARGADGLGISQNQIARAVQTMTEAFKVSGVSTRMQATAVMELSEAFGAGTLQGNHLKILMADAPRLAKIFADSLGVPVSRLRELGSQGKLTSEQLIKAVTDTGMGAKLDAELATVPKTWGDVVTEVKNDAYQLAYAVTSGGDLASKVFDALSGSVSSILPVMTSLGQGLGEIFSAIGSLFTSAYDSISSVGGGADTSMTAIQGFQVAIKVAADFVSALINDISVGFSIAVGVIDTVRQILVSLSSALGDNANVAAQSMRDQAIGWIGLGNEVKVFTMGMSSAFSTAFESIGEMFTDVENRAKSFFSGNFTAFSGVGASLAKEFSVGHNAINGLFDAAKNAGSKEVAGSIYDQIVGKNKKPQAVGDGTGTTRKVATEPKEDKNAEKKAAELAKKISEFWAQLNNATNSEQLYGQALEISNKIFDYRKIVGDKLSDQDKARIASLIQEKDLNNAIAKLKEDTANLKLANDNTVGLNTYTSSQQAAVNAAAKAAAAGASGMDALVARSKAADDAQKAMNDNIAVYKDVQSKVLADAQKGVDTTTATYQAALKLYEIEERRKETLAHISDELGKGQAVIEKYDTLSGNAKKVSDFNSEIKSVQKDDAAGNVDHQAATRAIAAINNQIYLLDHTMETTWGDSIDQLGQQIKGQWGGAISGVGKLLQALVKGGAGDFSGFGGIGSIANLLSKNSSGGQTGFGKGLQASMKSSLTDVFSSNTWTKPFASMTNAFSDTKTQITSIFGKGGSAGEALGKLAGKGLAGAQEGDIANSLEKALGIKTSKTGAELGGAAGSLAFGPLGGIIGGALGGILGGLFKSTPKGGATITTGANGVLTSSTYGNNAKAEEAATGAATSVISGIQSVASQLGALVSGDSGISIGTYNGKWRVNTQGTKLGGSSSPVPGLTDFGDDEAAAVSYAIKAAIDKGVLSGLDTLTQKIIQTNSDLDTAIQIAKQWQAVVVDQKFASSGIQDGLVAEDALNKSLEALEQQLKAAGASAADMSTFYAYAQEQAAKGLKSLLAPLTSLTDTLNGTGTGVTEYNQLIAKQQLLAGYQATIASGGTVNTDDFTAAVQSILQLSGDVYGTASSQFQTIRGQLISANDAEIANATKSYNDNLSAAAKQQQATTDAITAQTNMIGIQNAQMIAALQAIQSNTSTSVATSGGGGALAVNGRLVNAV